MGLVCRLSFSAVAPNDFGLVAGGEIETQLLSKNTK